MKNKREQYIQSLEDFKNLLYSYKYNGSPELRTTINKKCNYTQKLVKAANAARTITIAPPPAVGGMIMRDLNPFDLIFMDYHGVDIIQTLADSIDEAIGHIEHDENFSLDKALQVQNNQEIRKPVSSKVGMTKENTRILGMPQEVFWPLFATIIAGAFYIGLRLGQAKFDIEKLDLYNSNRSFKLDNYNLLKQLGVEQRQARELRDSLIELRTHTNPIIKQHTR